VQATVGAAGISGQRAVMEGAFCSWGAGKRAETGGVVKKFASGSQMKSNEKPH